MYESVTSHSQVAAVRVDHESLKERQFQAHANRRCSLPPLGPLGHGTDPSEDCDFSQKETERRGREGGGVSLTSKRAAVEAKVNVEEEGQCVAVCCSVLQRVVLLSLWKGKGSAYVLLFTNRRECMYMCTNRSKCIYMCTNTCTYMCTYIYIYVYICICIYL